MKKTPLKIRAVFFDAGNTLLRAHPSVGHIYARTARRHGVRISADLVNGRFQEAWRRRHGIEHLKSDRAEREWWRTMVHGVMGAHFTPAKFRRYFDELYGQFAHPRHWRLFDDTIPTLRALRSKGFRVGIVSNWDSRLPALAERIGLTREVEFLVVSSIEGVVKPDRRIFQKALALAETAASHTLHVGDSLHEDYHGARRAGLQAVLLDRHAPGPRGIARVQSLTEIVSMVEGKK